MQNTAWLLGLVAGSLRQGRHASPKTASCNSSCTLLLLAMVSPQPLLGPHATPVQCWFVVDRGSCWCALSARTQSFVRCTGSRIIRQWPTNLSDIPVKSKILGAGGDHPPLSSRPELAEQWHPTKNGDKAPASVTLGSAFTAWWLCTPCSCGQPHEWQAKVYARALSRSGCPIYAGRQPCRCGSLAALRPEVAAEWHPAGNRELTPEGVTPFSSRKVHWVCHKHSALFTWAASVSNRTKAHKPTGCPLCAREARRPRQRKHFLPHTRAVISGSVEGEELNIRILTP